MHTLRTLCSIGCLTLTCLTAQADEYIRVVVPRIDATTSLPTRTIGNADFGATLTGSTRVRAGWMSRQQIDLTAEANATMQGSASELGWINARASNVRSNRIRSRFLGTAQATSANANISLTATVWPGGLGITLGSRPLFIPGGSLSATLGANLSATNATNSAQLSGAFSIQAQGNMNFYFPHPLVPLTYFRVNSTLRFVDMSWSSTLRCARATLVSGSSTATDAPARLRVTVDWLFFELRIARATLVNRALPALTANMRP